MLFQSYLPPLLPLLRTVCHLRPRPTSNSSSSSSSMSPSSPPLCPPSRQDRTWKQKQFEQGGQRRGYVLGALSTTFHVLLAVGIEMSSPRGASEHQVCARPRHAAPRCADSVNTGSKLAGGRGAGWSTFLQTTISCGEILSRGVGLLSMLRAITEMAVQKDELSRSDLVVKSAFAYVSARDATM